MDQLTGFAYACILVETVRSAKRRRKCGMNTTRFDFSAAERGLVFCAAFAITVAGLRAASSIVILFLVAFFISTICLPVLNVLQRRLPYSLALSLVLLVLSCLFISVPIIVGGSLQRMLRSLPEFQEQLRSWEMALLARLDSWDLNVSPGGIAEFIDPSILATWLTRFLNGLIRLFKDGILVLVMIAFMLTETSWFSMKVSVIDEATGNVTTQVSRILVNVRRYLGIKTVVSVATGLSVWLGLLILRIEYAIVWGFIAFLMNYIPSIGSAIAGIPPVLLCFAQYGPVWAFAVFLLYFAVNTIWGSVIEPRFQGRGLGLSPLIVFISLIFWGWVFGPVGMLLSAPLTMVVKIALEESPETRWIAVMLGGKPELKSVNVPDAPHCELH